MTLLKPGKYINSNGELVANKVAERVQFTLEADRDFKVFSSRPSWMANLHGSSSRARRPRKLRR